MRQVALTKGKVAFVDDEDFELINSFNWYAEKNRHVWYAARKKKANNISKKIYMHRFLMGNPDYQVDHKNGDGLDNRRENLRLATNSQNQANKKNHTRFRFSKFRGVAKSGKAWTATVIFNQKRCYLGSFKTEIEAAKTYDKKAKELFGEFANLNFPENNTETSWAAVNAPLVTDALALGAAQVN